MTGPEIVIRPATIADVAQILQLIREPLPGTRCIGDGPDQLLEVRPTLYGRYATPSISTAAPRARTAPPTVIRAGGSAPRTSRYAAFIS